MQPVGLALLDDDELSYSDLDESVPPPGSETPNELRRGSTFQLRDPDFLWNNWITRNSFNLITGDPGAGKSTVLADLVARLTSLRGRWPDGSEIVGAPYRVALINLEDPPDQMFLPRITAAGGNVDLVWVAPEGIISYDEASLGWLNRQCEANQIQIVVSDQMSMGFDPRSSIYDYAAMYREGSKINHWCRRHGRTALMAHHHRKGKGETMIERVGGTNGLVAVARTVVQVYIPHRRHEDNNRYVGVTKPNPDADLPNAIPFGTFAVRIPQRERFVWCVDWREQLEEPLENLYGRHYDENEGQDGFRKGAKIPEIHARIKEDLLPTGKAGLLVSPSYRKGLQGVFGCSEKTIDRALASLHGVQRKAIPGVGLLLTSGDPEVA